MRLSIIVPVLDEEKALPAFLASVAQWDGDFEILFVDGGSSDSTRDLLKDFEVLDSTRGRGAQCRLGTKHACGDALAFVHVDSFVPPESMQAILDALDGGTPWGCLTLRFDAASLMMRIGAWGSNARVRLTGIPFGDQVMFMTRSAYESVGGMPDMPIMEDYELSRRLRQLAWPKQLPQTVCTSARRFAEGGILKTMLQMRRLRYLYRKGVAADELAQMYRNVRDGCREGRSAKTGAINSCGDCKGDTSHAEY